MEETLFRQELQKRTAAIEKLLKEYLPAEEGYQKTVIEAMNYSLMAGGKRLRPMLMQETYKMFGGDGDIIEPFMAAIEMIHTFSLVHDDLPCMDNDDMRRGKPSNHMVFGEAQALLAGDGLLTYAFEWMLEAGIGFNNLNYYRAVAEIAKRAGVSGMVAGQSIDLISQTEGIKNEDELNYIHRHKTADLLIASVIAGALCANPTDIQLKTLEGYAEKIGILFQITDDILDAEGDETLVGKTLHKDETDKKLTYVSLYGVERSKNMAQQIAQEAERLLFTTFGENCKYLYDVIYYILNRNK